jgi:hypothetical protein
MAETIDELTIEWTEPDGTVTVKELDKQVLTKGSWTTVMYKYQDLKRGTTEFGAPKVRIQRYRKRDGRFLPQSKFNITNEKQAKMIVEILEGWFGEDKG